MALTRKEKLLKAMLEDNAAGCGGGVTREERMLASVAKKTCDNDLLNEDNTSSEPICGDERITVTWDGTWDKSVDTPGTTNKAWANDVYRYWKISDNVPTKEELFADNVKLTRSGTLYDSAISDVQFVGDGWYGRWGHSAYVNNSALNEDGTMPLVIVAEKPCIFDPGGDASAYPFNLSEPGIYCATGNKPGKQLGFESMTYGWFKQLDEKYIPDTIARTSQVGEGGGGIGNIVITSITDEDDNTVFTCNVSNEELMAALEDGTPVFFKGTTNDINLVSSMVCAYQSGDVWVVRFMFATGFSEADRIVISVSSDGIDRYME